jgi:hypothetical protein
MVTLACYLEHACKTKSINKQQSNVNWFLLYAFPEGQGTQPASSLKGTSFSPGSL